MRALYLTLCLAATFALVACGGESAPVALNEPLRVVGGVFKAGEFPATANAANSGDAGSVDTALEVTEVEAASAPAHPGQTGKVLNGRVSDDSYAIAVRFSDLGTGYWVLPVGAPDLSFPGELTWRLPIELSSDIPPGNHTLELVAIDGNGHGGPKHEQSLCVLPPFDDTLNACDPKTPPPAAILSLTWDANSDLDLLVKTPSGKWVSAKAPATSAASKIDVTVPGVGLLDGDSNAACRIDGIRREDLIFASAPEHGRYEVYTNLFNACGKATTRFQVSAYARARGTKAGTFSLIAIAEPSYGELLAASANGGEKIGLYVTSVEFP